MVAMPTANTGPANPPPPQVALEWLRRVEAEYRSAALTQGFTLWLTQLGAPMELLRVGLRIASDELTHAELAAQVHRAAGGEQAPQLQRDSLALPRTPGSPLEHDVLRVAVETYCLGETAAVRIFGRMKKQSTVLVVQRALRRILRDEVLHRDFGWELLGWLLETPMGPTLRALLTAELPAMLARQRSVYGGAALREHGLRQLEDQARELDANTRGWGLISAREYISAVEETSVRDYAPRLAALGLALPAQADTP
jgi:hypothetical protein